MITRLRMVREMSHLVSRVVDLLPIYELFSFCYSVSMAASTLELQRSIASSSGVMSRNTNEYVITYLKHILFWVIASG